MPIRTCAAAVCAVAIALAAAAPADAAASQKKRTVAAKKVAMKGPPPRARITVQRRSFLDPGKHVLPGSRSEFTDYAFPPAYSPTGVIENRAGLHRSPLPGPFDLPGRDNPWPWNWCTNC